MKFDINRVASLHVLALASSILGHANTSFADPLQARQGPSTWVAASSSSSATLAIASTGTIASTSPSTTSPATTSAASAAAQTGSLTTGSSVATATVSQDPLSPSGTFAANVPQCVTADVGPYKPFCLPVNATIVYAGATNPVTWDPTAFTNGTLIIVKLRYFNATPPQSEIAWTSDQWNKNWAGIDVTYSSDWLEGYSWNNLTFELHALDPASGKPEQVISGPTITVTTAPPVHYSAVPTPFPNRIGLELGIPLGVGFLLLVLFGLWVGMRNHRRIDVGGLSSLMKRKRGYGVGKSRRQRLGKKGGIALADTHQGPTFRDDPSDDVELQQGVHSPQEDRWNYQQENGNAFREEVRRQQTGR